VVSLSAGNAGPGPSTVFNNAPGAITVAANTLPRSVVAVLQLGDGTHLEGGSEQSDPLGPFPLIYSGNASASGGVVRNAQLCAPGSLNPLVVAGKAVVSAALSEQGMTAITECRAFMRHGQCDDLQSRRAQMGASMHAPNRT